MDKIQAEGRLMRRYNDPVEALVVLGFNSPECAKQARKTLGSRWKHTSKDESTRVLFWTGTNRELHELKILLASYGADPEAIDSLKQSLDFGEFFSVRIPVT
jgi:hypothetical protein